MSNVKVLEDAYRDLDAAKARVHRATIDCLPIGCCVTFVTKRGGVEYRHWGTVKRHGYDDTVFVQNGQTMVERRMSARQLEFVKSRAEG